MRKDNTQVGKIVLNFPKDVTPVDVQDFGPGGSSTFFSEFNGKNNEFTKIMRDQKFYGTKVQTKYYRGFHPISTSILVI